MLMSGILETNEPLTIENARRFFEKLDTLPVILDEVIIRRQNFSYRELDFEKEVAAICSF